MEEEKKVTVFGKRGREITLTGKAAEILLNKIEEKKEEGVKVYGKETAIQSLLCELYHLRKVNQEKKPNRGEAA